MTTDDDRRRALGDLVRKRREFLEMSIDEAASRAPMGPTTWTRVEQGKNVRGLTLPGIDRVLRWPDNASRDFLDGGPQPRELPAATAAVAEGTATANDATVTTLPNRSPAHAEEVAESVGLPTAPPFPKPKGRAQEAVNRYWEAIRAIAEGAGDEEPPADRTVRALRRAALDLEEFRESAEGRA